MPLPDDVTPALLDPDVRSSLLTLSRETADLVARHLVMTGRLLDVDPQQALVHARAAGALAGRVADVREAVGIAAYTAGEWAEGLSELRAARRMSGSPEQLAVMADCERALGRPERALAMLDDPDVPRLEQATRVELVIVVAGARRDMGQGDAAVLLLQGPARATTAKRPWAARLWYAYADALLEAGREELAREWFEKAAGVDEDGQTDAAERLLVLEGVSFDDERDDEDHEDDDLDEGDAALSAEALRELVAGIAVPQRPDAGAGEEPGSSDDEEAGSAPALLSQHAYEAEAASEVAVRATAAPGSSPFAAAAEPAAAPARRAPAAVPTVAFVPPAEDGEQAGESVTGEQADEPDLGDEPDVGDEPGLGDAHELGRIADAATSDDGAAGGAGDTDR